MIKSITELCNIFKYQITYIYNTFILTLNDNLTFRYYNLSSPMGAVARIELSFMTSDLSKPGM